MSAQRAVNHLQGARLAAILAAAMLAVALLGASAQAALAGPESNVDLAIHIADTEDAATGDPPTVCGFHVHFVAEDPEDAIEGTWELRSGADDGPMVLTGVYDTAGDSRAPASGAFDLEDGTYFMTWDDEIEVDLSFDSQEIVVSCEGEELPTEEVPPTQPTPPNNPAPPTSGNELPVGGGVRGVTATPPATDGPVEAGTGSANVAAPLIALFALSLAALVWSGRARRTTRLANR